MMNSGSAMMGVGRASGENRATEAAQLAISSPLLEETIHGATGVILNITGGDSLTLLKFTAADVIYGAVDPDANILFGSVIDEGMKEEISITVIATGFSREENEVSNAEEFSFSMPEKETKLEAPTVQQATSFSSFSSSKDEEESEPQQQFKETFSTEPEETTALPSQNLNQ